MKIIGLTGYKDEVIVTMTKDEWYFLTRAAKGVGTEAELYTTVKQAYVEAERVDNFKKNVRNFLGAL